MHEESMHSVSCIKLKEIGERRIESADSEGGLSIRFPLVKDVPVGSIPAIIHNIYMHILML